MDSSDWDKLTANEVPPAWERLMADSVEGTFDPPSFDLDTAMAEFNEGIFGASASISDITPQYLSPYGFQSDGVYAEMGWPLSTSECQWQWPSAPPPADHSVKHKEPKTVVRTEKSENSKDKNDDDSYILEDIFNESGSERGKMEESDARFGGETEGMEACDTALKCLICGNKLCVSASDDDESIVKQVVNGCCEVCGCFGAPYG
ncbi:hypothetical protein GGR53DRAFT_470586 [Hypoxylon sp. FL1150]|nr:hypothetical protein GGR53DRAFT_470586 [Hypoxylon sp. FL1150]